MSWMVPNLEGAFSRLIPPRDDLLLELERQAEAEDIPIIGPAAAEFLQIIARFRGAERILELGTATGYSAIYLARALPEGGGKLTCVEWNQAMAGQAGENLARAGLDSKAEIMVGDAEMVMSTLEPGFDLIFIDIDKQGYAPALPQCRRLLKTGGLLFADNTGFKEAQDFNRILLDSPHWQVAHLLCFLPLHDPELDGISLALKIG